MSCLVTTLVLLAAISGPSEPWNGTASDPAAAAEEFHYRWRLGNLVGFFAGFFLPSSGEGVLSATPIGDGLLRSELRITSEEGDAGEYWAYGAEHDPLAGVTRRAWSSYFFRGKKREREGEIDEQGVVDVVTGIYQLRRDPPEEPRRLEIWSDGKIYPVEVTPKGIEGCRVGDRVVPARHLAIRGVPRADGSKWQGKLDLWLARDAASTPVKIVIERRHAAVRLKLSRMPT